MSAALSALHGAIKVDPKPYKNLIPSFTSILKQVAEHRLPKTYDYHRFPAPFIQVGWFCGDRPISRGGCFLSEPEFVVGKLYFSLSPSHTHPSSPLLRTLLHTLQIKLLKILALLGMGDRASSENMYTVIQQTLRRANSSHTIGSALIYECVRTITTIYPNPALLAACE